MADFGVSNHAIDQYRQRVIGCPERARSNAVLLAAIKQQLLDFPLRSDHGATVVAAGPVRPKRRKPWEMTLNYPTHMFVIDAGVVVTTLGFMMRPKKKASRRARRRRVQLYRERAALLPMPRRDHLDLDDALSEVVEGFPRTLDYLAK